MKKKQKQKSKANNKKFVDVWKLVNTAKIKQQSINTFQVFFTN